MANVTVHNTYHSWIRPVKSILFLYLKKLAVTWQRINLTKRVLVHCTLEKLKARWFYICICLSEDHYVYVELKAKGISALSINFVMSS